MPGLPKTLVRLPDPEQGFKSAYCPAAARQDLFSSSRQCQCNLRDSDRMADCMLTRGLAADEDEALSVPGLAKALGGLPDLEQGIASHSRCCVRLVADQACVTDEDEGLPVPGLAKALGGLPDLDRGIAPHSRCCVRLLADQACAADEDEGLPVPGLAKALGGLPDLERGIARLLHRTANPAEFLATLQALAGLRKRLKIQVIHQPCSTAA